jgi:glycosyltransferase involved in cell wall biosynthesis
MRGAGLVVAGNEYLRLAAMNYGAQRVVIVPTVIDMEKYVPADSDKRSDYFTIGWIGSPITFKYLPYLRPVLEEIASQYKIRVKLIGLKTGIGLPDGVEELIPWTEENEAEHIRSFDVGIMPLEDNIWERGKCGYKLIQYMGCSVPVIGTPIGVNDSLIRDGFNGFKATSLEEWKRGLVFMITHPQERKEMGLNGRNFVEQNYSLQKYREVWLDLLKGRGSAFR